MILENISNKEYHESEKWKKYISSSVLKRYLRSPRYKKWFDTFGEDSIGFEAAHFGSVYHAVMESYTNTGDMTGFHKEYELFDHPANKKTGEPMGINTIGYKALYEQCENECCSDVVLKQATDMYQSMIHDPVYGKWIEKKMSIGKAERSYFIDYAGGGFFKVRPDLETKKTIIDWKTCREEYPRVELFQKQIIDMGYHISAAMYQYFIHEETGVWKKFYWVAQEKTPPYDLMVYDSAEWTWDIISDGEGGVTVFPKIGAMMFMDLLETHITCLTTEKYPGYSVFVQPDWRGSKVHRIPVPGWYENKAENLKFNL